MRKIIIISLLLFCSASLFSQSTDDRAKAYYTEASNAYKNGKYSSAIEFLDKTEEILGKTNARILNLKVKASYANGDYERAKKNLDLFSKHSSNATQELKDETYAYIVKVEMAIQKEEAARLAVLKKAEDARIADEKRIEAERTAKIEKENAEREAAIAHYKKYQTDHPYTNSRFIVPYEKSGSWGFINSSGETIVPFKYEEAKTAGEGMGMVKEDGKWGFVNDEGLLITSIKYPEVKGFREGLAPVEIYPFWGYINKEGEEVIGQKYLGAWRFKNGLAPVMEYTGEGVGFINKKGELIIPYDYESTGYFYDGLARVKRKGKWGYINIQNEIVIPIKYEEVQRGFLRGYAGVKKSGFWGIINKSGKVKIPFKYSSRKLAMEQLKLSGYLEDYWKTNAIQSNNTYISVERQCSPRIKIENIEFDSIQHHMVVKLHIDLGYRRGALNPPGSETAYCIKDNNGKKYVLIKQEGWKGDGEDGFGEMGFKGNPITLKLYFEILDPFNVTSFDLLEGNCDTETSSCWNFYGIKILNK